MNKLETITNRYGQGVTAKETKYLLSFDIKTSNLYGLNKIHDSQIIHDKFKNFVSSYIDVEHLTDLKIRPIIAGPTCETHNFFFSIL
jgi:hypothetical protein